MAVTFLDTESGEVSNIVIDVPEGHEEYVSERRAARGQAPVPDKRERKRTPIWPVFVVAALIIGFLVGGGVAAKTYQEEIHNLKVELGYPDVP